MADPICMPSDTELKWLPAIMTQGWRQTYMPGKARKGEAGSTVRDPEDTLPLLSLPSPVLARIAELGLKSYSYRGHPLLGVSQACRDAVLHATKTISFVPECTPTRASPAEKSADAGLLHRACCEASPGLEVRLDVSDPDSDMLSVLLQPGITSGGWTKVHALRVSHTQGPVHQIPLAFPSLRKLSLSRTQLRDGAIFGMLAGQASCMLRSLEIINCRIDMDSVGRAAHSLAHLAHLQAFLLVGAGVPVTIAAQLTGLTRLSCGNDADTEQMFTVAAQNTRLVQLEFGYARAPVQANHQFTLLSACTHLTQLDIGGLHIDGQALDLLLTHCTSITDLTLGPTTLDSSRAHRQCSWQSLRLDCSGPDDRILLQLAYLPLRSVQKFTRYCRALSGTLDLPPPDAVPAAQLPSLLHQAATNLASCPAWVSAPPSVLRLHGGGQGLTAHQRVQLFRALAPLGAPHVTEVTIDLREQLELGCAEVQALGSSIGGGLQTLRLGNCTLLTTFWEALAQHLPQLSSIVLLTGTKSSAQDIAECLATRSCSSTQLTCLRIVCGGARDREFWKVLEEHVRDGQLPNITLLWE